MIHELKTWPEPFAAILDGRKAFEVRKADRPFMVGDTLHLREWNPNGSGYTGRETAAVVTYIVSPGAWGLPPDLCVMGFGSPPPAPETSAREGNVDRSCTATLGPDEDDPHVYVCDRKATHTTLHSTGPEGEEIAWWCSCPDCARTPASPASAPSPENPRRLYRYCPGTDHPMAPSYCATTPHDECEGCDEPLLASGPATKEQS